GQMLAILALWGGLVLLSILVDRGRREHAPTDGRVWFKIGRLPVGPWTAAYLALLCAPMVTSMLLPNGQIDLWPLTGTAGLFMAALLSAARYLGKRRRRRTGPPLAFHNEQAPGWGPALVASVSVALPMALLVPGCLTLSNSLIPGTIYLTLMACG